jgi:muramoyltetrapeptide carboxypeptidase
MNLSILKPARLQKGDQVRVIAPSCSLSIISETNIALAIECLEKMGLVVTFGKNVRHIDEFGSSSIASRIADLHEAFADPDVKMILPVIGGHNCNQLLEYIDWNLIKNNPKLFGGFSDTTALHNAVYAMTGLVTFQSPSFSTLAKLKNSEYTVEYFRKCFFQEAEYELTNSLKWDDSAWFVDQENYGLFENTGAVVVNPGSAQGPIIGGNLCTLNLLQGTQYMPAFEQPTILFLEDDSASDALTFDRDLVSLIAQKGFENVKAIVFGRFQIRSKITLDTLKSIINSKQELRGLPIIANLDFGHTSPLATFGIGASCRVEEGKVFVSW